MVLADSARLAGLALVGMAVAIAGCQPCITSDMCGAGNICIGGTCSPKSSQAGGNGVGPGMGASSSSGGATDGGATTQPVDVTLLLAPTAVALNESGTQALVATEGDGTNRVVYKVSLPPAAPSNDQVTLSGAASQCRVTRLVNRGAYLYAACDGTPAFVRVYNAATGQLAGVDRTASEKIRLVDHASVLVMDGVPGPGGAVFTQPATTPTTVQDVPNPAQVEQLGLALVENSTSAVVAAVTVASNPNQLFYYTLAVPTWGAPLLFNPPGGFLPTYITSGTRHSTMQGVVLFDGLNNQVVVFTGADVTSAASGAALNPVRTVTGVTPANPVNIQARRDGQYAYYLSATNQVCRFPLTASANPTDAAECVDLPVGCGAVDVAPPTVASAPTVVACAGLTNLRVLPSF